MASSNIPLRKSFLIIFLLHPETRKGTSVCPKEKMGRLHKLANIRLKSTYPVFSKLFHSGPLGADNVIRGDKTLPLPEVDLYTFFERKFQQYGENLALVDGSSGEKMTYKQLISRANKLASFFEKRGYKIGDTMGIHVPNCIDYQSFIFGSLGKGITFTTCNPIYTAHEVNQWLCSSNAKALFTNSNLVDLARKAAENTDTELLVSIDDCSIQDSGIMNLSDIIENSSEDFERPLIKPKEDIACMVYSSGTTGLPKGVMLTHHNLTTNVLQMNEATPHNESVLCVLPMFHIYGIDYINFLHLFKGATVVSLPAFDPGLFLSTIQKLKVDKVCIVPPILLFMVNHPIVDKFDLSCVRNATVGAAPADEHVITKFTEKFPNATLIQGYGSSEGLITHLQPVDMSKHRPGSAGYGVSHVDFKIQCVETGKSLGPNEQGELRLKGPQVMKGYYQNEKATSNTIDEDGWMSTGDLGFFDEEGNIFVIDRLKELIKYKSFQVAPAELEATLLTHPDVVDSCVIGIPDETAGQLPRAYVVRSEGSALTEEEVNSFIGEYLSPHKQLRGGVVFVDALPKSASGKLLRRVLLQEFIDANSA